MADKIEPEWVAGNVRKWLESRIAAARADQIAAERAGWGHQDDCDKSTAEEMLCTLLRARPSIDDQKMFERDLRDLLARDEYIWRGVHDYDRFERHVRSHLRKLIKMTRANEGFGKLARYQ